ncbi:MAG: hypothetical protein ABEH64_07240 [Salinirussus sp.]
MESVPGYLEERRGSAALAFSAIDRSTEPTWDMTVEAAWKAGNLLSHYGVHPGATVAIVAGPGEPTGDTPIGRLGSSPEPLFALLGALSVGATVELDPAGPVSATALIAPAAWHDRYDIAAGCSRFAYGAEPAAPATIHFERARWSENPIAPPDAVPGDSEAIPGRTQQSLLEEASEIVSTHDLVTGTTVRTSGTLTAAALPGAVLAPLLSEATIIGGDGPADLVVDTDGTVSESTDTRRA